MSFQVYMLLNNNDLLTDTYRVVRQMCTGPHELSLHANYMGASYIFYTVYAARQVLRELKEILWDYLRKTGGAMQN